MFAEAWLEDLLPTKWSRRLAVATCVVAAAAFGVPSLLPQSYLPASPEQVFLLRLFLLLLVSLVGSLAVLVLVIRAFRTQSEKHQGEIEVQKKEHDEAISTMRAVAAAHSDSPEQEQPLTDMHEKVLGLLFERPQTVDQVRRFLGVGAEQAKFYLHDLLARGLVSHPAPYAPGPEEWRINQDGRQHVMRRGAP